MQLMEHAVNLLRLQEPGTEDSMKQGVRLPNILAQGLQLVARLADMQVSSLAVFPGRHRVGASMGQRADRVRQPPQLSRALALCQTLDMDEHQGWLSARDRICPEVSINGHLTRSQNGACWQ